MHNILFCKSFTKNFFIHINFFILNKSYLDYFQENSVEKLDSEYSVIVLVEMVEVIEFSTEEVHHSYDLVKQIVSTES